MAHPRDRLRHWEARILVLRIAASFPNNEATIGQIKGAVSSLVKLTKIDLEQFPTRPNECKWQQIIEDVILDEKSTQSIFRRGYAIRLDDGIRLRGDGLAYLKMKGY